MAKFAKPSSSRMPRIKSTKFTPVKLWRWPESLRKTWIASKKKSEYIIGSNQIGV